MKSEEIRLLLNELANLPQGSIVRRKSSKGIRFSHQWRDEGRTCSVEIAASDVPELEKKIERRKEIARILRTEKSGIRTDMPEPALTMDVKTGRTLVDWASVATEWDKRDCFGDLMKFLRWRPESRVLLIYGLRRTGKTTMLQQAVLAMDVAERERAAYVKAKASETMADLNRTLRTLEQQGVRYVLIDEVTLLSDFIDGAALLSDIYAPTGMKIVLSGTDSLGFWLTLRQELYDRAYTFHTTHIPFREHSRLLKTDDIDEYIRYGGMLRAGELAFDDPTARADDASFRDDESTRRYIDTAIARNIQHSLDCCEGGRFYRHLIDLRESGELTGAVNRVIEDMNHAFLLSVLARDFKSHDLGLTARNLRQHRDPNIRRELADDLDIASVTKELMSLLDVRNAAERQVPLKQVHADEIREYLRALDLIAECPVKTLTDDGILGPELSQTLFVQPGMRFCQAQALVLAMMKDAKFSALSEDTRRRIAEHVLEEVAGRMLEEIVLLETRASVPRPKDIFGGLDVFKLRFSAGEFDMVIRDNAKGTVELFEIKHSQVISPDQARHLTDDGMLALTERQFGRITGRTVLYRGENTIIPETGIRYQNVNEYLKKRIVA